MQNLQLIIFDLDGVVIDSEYLIASQQNMILNKAGHKMNIDEFIKKYVNITWKEILKDIEQQSPLPISAKLIDIWENIEQTLIKDIALMDGFLKAANDICLPKALTTNRSNKWIKQICNKFKLEHIFNQNIFSAPEVETQNIKITPDRFLSIAEKTKAKPQNTIIIEDSVIGVKAAVAAGMRVIGFTGGKHSYLGHSSLLMEAGAETSISHFKDLPAVVKAMDYWTNNLA
ncbi:HAD family hydrolase [Bartonella sp. DGB1]|uniref:HAD family hydrolase n=1 Tax=Bartonella sp. DGB1 TaxID=3239807 RepID=UPI0035258934